MYQTNYRHNEPLNETQLCL